MRYTLLLTTQYFIDKFSQKELNSFEIKYDVIDEGFYEIQIDSEKDLVEIVLKLLYYSRTLNNIYLKVGESTIKGDLSVETNLFNNIKNKDLRFHVEDDEISRKILDKFENKISSEFNFEIDKTGLKFEVFDEEEDGYIVVLDLIGFDLSKRNYKLREFEDSLNPIVANYLFYLVGLDKEEKLKILDPYAQIGDLSIESSLFLPRLALNVKEKREINLAKLFNLPLGIPKKNEDNNKLVAVVEGDDVFKYFRENLSYASTKIKVTQFDFDWLDVKYHRGDFDYILTQFPYFENEDEKKEFEDPFFYQGEFVAKKAIGIITESEIDMTILEKYNLKIDKKEEVELDNEQYLIYVIKHK